jgi:hypothetical protein
VKIHQQVELYPGDVILVGKQLFRFEADALTVSRPCDTPIAGAVRAAQPPEAATADRVDVTAFAPPSVAPGDVFLVQIFAHLPLDAAEAEALARGFDPTARRRAFKSLEAAVPRGARLAFHLAMPGFDVDDPTQALVWSGRTEAVQFGVAVPEDFARRAVVGSVVVSLDSVPIGHVKFTLAIEGHATAAPARPLEPAGDEARRYRRAFISYASPDRAKVLPRIQMLRVQGIEFFQDLLNLDPGQRWEREIYRHIDACDVFLLFWSSSARASEWVLREVRYALARKGGDALRPPEILPIPIEGPPIAPPPAELAELHFNDRILYFIAAEEVQS